MIRHPTEMGYQQYDVYFEKHLYDGHRHAVEQIPSDELNPLEQWAE